MENDYEVNSLESGLKVESLRGDTDSNLDENECDGWTNEKHNSYLDTLENSFVRQLYSFLGGEETWRQSTTRHVQSNSHRSTHQFTVLQNGYLQKVAFGKKRAYLEMSADQGNVLCKEETENSGDKAFTRTCLRNSLGNEYPSQCTAEASGQNFREGGEKGYDSGVSRKRRREAISYDKSSLNDQVVP